MGKRRRVNESGARLKESKYAPFAGDCVVSEADLLNQDNELVLIRLPATVDPRVLHGTSINLHGGSIDGAQYSLAVDDTFLREQLTIFIPGGQAGLAIPIDRPIHSALTMLVPLNAAVPGIPSTGRLGGTGKSTMIPESEIAISLKPREMVPQMPCSKMRYKLHPIGYGSMPILPRSDGLGKKRHK